jgi:ABC-type Fe3+-hydroxamate transport system substrate-binding protein
MPQTKLIYRRLLKITAFAGLLGFANLRPGQTAIVVTDSLGREVALPRQAKRVLSLQPEITRLIVALGAGDRLVGIDFFLRTHDHLFKIILPGQERLPLVSMANYSVNMEVLAGLAPDVIFGAPEDPNVIAALETKTRVPVAAFSSMGRFDKLLDELRLVGRILGRDDRAAELAAAFRNHMAALKARLADIPPSGKPKVFLSFWNVFTNTPVAYEPVDAAGGVNVAEGLLPSFAGTLNAVVPVEQVLRWAPDIILLQGNYPPDRRTVTVAAALADRRLASLRAVKGKRVHYTFGFWNWWDFALAMVETSYLAKLFYPDRFTDVDLAAEGNAIFKMVYGIENGYSALCRIIRCDEWVHAR